MSNPPGVALWHQALAYAVTGQRLEELGRPTRPDVSRLAAELQARQVAGEIQLVDPPVEVPTDLMAGLGAAQFWVALTALRQALAKTPSTSAVISTRSLSPEERRLDGDRPPHH